jgi:hypothetical protein
MHLYVEQVHKIFDTAEDKGIEPSPPVKAVLFSKQVQRTNICLSSNFQSAEGMGLEPTPPVKAVPFSKRMQQTDICLPSKIYLSPLGFRRALLLFSISFILLLVFTAPGLLPWMERIVLSQFIL